MNTSLTSRRAARARTAFTVPELLAVVAIIVIILSILLPSMDWARYRTRATICVSNKHQIVLAVRAYAADHVSRFPNAQGGGNHYWMQDHPHVLFTAGRDYYNLPLEMWTCAASDKPSLPYHWGGYNPDQKWKMNDSAWWVIRGSIGNDAKVGPARPNLVSDRTGLVPGSSVIVSEKIQGTTVPTSSPHTYKGKIYDAAVGKADGSGELIRVEHMTIRLANEGWGNWWY